MRKHTNRDFRTPPVSTAPLRAILTRRQCKKSALYHEQWQACMGRKKKEEKTFEKEEYCTAFLGVQLRVFCLANYCIKIQKFTLNYL